MKAIVYTSEGQPLLFNLDLFHISVPKLDLSKTYYVIFTATISQAADNIPAHLMEVTANPVDIKIQRGDLKFVINVDLTNNLSLLKNKIFTKTGIPPMNQIIKFANNALVNDAEVL